MKAEAPRVRPPAKPIASRREYPDSPLSSGEEVLFDILNHLCARRNSSVRAIFDSFSSEPYVTQAGATVIIDESIKSVCCHITLWGWLPFPAALVRSASLLFGPNETQRKLSDC